MAVLRSRRAKCNRTAGVIVDCVGFELGTYDDMTRVPTNAPTQDWHLANVRNCLDLSTVGLPSMRFGAVYVTAIAPGGGPAAAQRLSMRRSRGSSARSLKPRAAGTYAQSRIAPHARTAADGRRTAVQRSIIAGFATLAVDHGRAESDLSGCRSRSPRRLHAHLRPQGQTPWH